MNKDELIIETLAFMQNKEKKLLEQSKKTIGDIVDSGFTKETKAYVQLMTRLYEIYDDLENEDKEENLRRMKEVGLVKRLDNNSNLLSIKDADIEKISKYIKNLPPVNMIFDIPKLDYTKFVRRRDD